MSDKIQYDFVDQFMKKDSCSSYDIYYKCQEFFNNGYIMYGIDSFTDVKGTEHFVFNFKRVKNEVST